MRPANNIFVKASQERPTKGPGQEYIPAPDLRCGAKVSLQRISERLDGRINSTGTQKLLQELSGDICAMSLPEKRKEMVKCERVGIFFKKLDRDFSLRHFYQFG